jgi:hypothetical protein
MKKFPPPPPPPPNFMNKPKDKDKIIVALFIIFLLISFVVDNEKLNNLFIFLFILYVSFKFWSRDI